MSDPDLPTYSVLEVWIKVHQGAAAGQEFALRSFPVVIGRGPTCDLRLEDDPLRPTMSRQHARLLLHSGRILLEDLSSNGTWVNSQQMVRGETRALHAGDSIWLGSQTLLTVERQPINTVLLATSHPAVEGGKSGGIKEPKPLVDVPTSLFAEQPTFGQQEKTSGGPVTLAVRALGEFEVSVDGTLVPAAVWSRNRKAVVLLTYLVDQAPHSVAVERLLEALWDDGGTRQAVQTAASRVRQALRGGRENLPDPLRMSYNQYILSDAYAVTYDVRSFEAGCARARRLWNEGDGERAEDALAAALDAYRGGFLEGATEDWAVRRRDTLQQSQADATDVLGIIRERRGDVLGALSLYRMMVARDAARESACEGVIRCLAALGRRDEALYQYQVSVNDLRRLLNVGPGRSLLELREAILDGRELPTPSLGGLLLRPAGSDLGDTSGSSRS